MRHFLIAAATLACMVAPAAQAAVTLEGITFDNATVGTPYSEDVKGANIPNAKSVTLYSQHSNLGVTYSSSAVLKVGNNGAGPVSAASGGLPDLTLTLASSTLGFTAIKFNIMPTGTGNNIFYGDITIDPANDDDAITFTNVAFNTNGNNRFSFEALDALPFRSISFTNLRNAGGVAQTFDSIRQVSFEAAAVPEASTWAMMIIGFGAVGTAMRRRRKVARKACQV